MTTFCAPPTVWRMLIQADLGSVKTQLREVVGAGEPLNPEVIEQVQKAWGLTLRDGFGQTETTLQIGNPPGQPIKPGSMGRPMPGYTVALIDPVTGEPADEGEICLPLANRPLGLMVGYRDDDERTSDAMRDGHYHTGDVASRDADGYITYVGRTDDVFKASDYRISPFELESVLIEHEAVAEAAVVPSPDPLRLAVPKAYVVLTAGHEPTRETALSILTHARAQLAPYKRIRRIEFYELPKTISGKIRRVELRAREEQDATGGWSEATSPSCKRLRGFRERFRDPGVVRGAGATQDRRMPPRVLSFLAALILVTLWAAPAARAGTFDRDTTWAHTGLAASPADGSARWSALAMLDDGRFLAAGRTQGGQAAVARFTAAGELDTTLGGRSTRPRAAGGQRAGRRHPGGPRGARRRQGAARRDDPGGRLDALAADRPPDRRRPPGQRVRRRRQAGDDVRARDHAGRPRRHRRRSHPRRRHRLRQRHRSGPVAAAHRGRRARRGLRDQAARSPTASAARARPSPTSRRTAPGASTSPAAGRPRRATSSPSRA